MTPRIIGPPPGLEDRLVGDPVFDVEYLGAGLEKLSELRCPVDADHHAGHPIKRESEAERALGWRQPPGLAFRLEGLDGVPRAGGEHWQPVGVHEKKALEEHRPDLDLDPALRALADMPLEPAVKDAAGHLDHVGRFPLQDLLEFGRGVD